MDFILQNCCDVEDNLRQLYRRVAFNIVIGDSEDQSLLINSQTNRADLGVLLNSSEEYLIGNEEAGRMIHEVTQAVKKWKTYARRLGISKREIEVFEQIYQRW